MSLATVTARRASKELDRRVRLELPFRMMKVSGASWLEYEERVDGTAGGVVLPFRHESYVRPYVQIVQLMEMYRDLETAYAVVSGERDELQRRVLEADGRVREM